MLFLRLTTVVGSGVMAGGQLFVLRSIIPAMRAWERRMSIRVHQELLTYRAHEYLSVVAVTTIVTGVILVLFDNRSPLRTVFTILGVAGQLANGIITARWQWPINAEVNTWPAESAPDKYETMRVGWDRKHRRRTVASIVSLSCFAVAAAVRVPG